MVITISRPVEFSFVAGQYLLLTLIDPLDAEGASRFFSIASPPYETETLMIAMRVRDTAFKRALGNMEIGAPIAIDGPFGGFTLHRDAEKPAVFLIGGIGITPVRSIALQATRDKLPHKITVFYSNRRPEDAVFLDEFLALEKENPNCRCVATMTEMEKSARPWDGERGFIDRAVLERHLPDLASPIYYICGPAAMVSAMRQLLESIPVDPDSIRAEEFSGY